MSAIREHIAQTRKLDPSAWLGFLVWYQVKNMRISHADLFQALVDCGLGGFCPRVPSDVDVFRRMCSASQRKKVPTGTGWVNYLVRDLPMDDVGVHKKLVRETVTAGKVVYQTELCQLDFVRATGTVEIDCDQTDQMACDISAEIVASYYAERGMMGSTSVRDLIRRIMASMNATNLRGPAGGLYFVSTHHADTIDALEALVGNDTVKGRLPPGSALTPAPLVRTDKQMEMVRRAYESELNEEIDRLVNEIAELITETDKKKKVLQVAALKTGPKGTPTPLATKAWAAYDAVGVNPDRVATYFDQLAEARAKLAEYHELLEGGLGEADSYVDIFQAQILELATRVKEG